MAHTKRMEDEEWEARLAKLPLDYSIYSTEDEEELSDYELDAKDLHPRRR